MNLTKVAIFCVLLALTISIVSSRKPNKVKRKKGRNKPKSTRRPLNITRTTTTSTPEDAKPLSGTIVRSPRSIQQGTTDIPVNPSKEEEFEMFKEQWQPPTDTRCCYFEHPCPVIRVVNNVKRVFSPHFWKRNYHFIVHGKDIGACDPAYCKCYTDDEIHACKRNDDYRCPCYEQYVERKKNQMKT
uniref:Uncharacterized protein n=1 Tax=Cacopsylla melanoneura TaxID=428564 RepID=A0A8D8WHG9_9HEMI